MTRMVNRTITRFKKDPVTQKALGINEFTEWNGPIMTKLKESLETVLEKHLDDPNASLSDIFSDDSTPEGKIAKYITNGTIKVTDGSEEKKKKVDAKVAEPDRVEHCACIKWVLDYIEATGMFAKGQLDPRHHHCYNQKCPCSSKAERKVYYRGELPHVMPKDDTVKIALNLSRFPEETVRRITEDWATGYHGTAQKAAGDIYAYGLRPSGTRVHSVKTSAMFEIGVIGGHFENPYTAFDHQTGEDVEIDPQKCVYVSPSPIYAFNRVYAPTEVHYGRAVQIAIVSKISPHQAKRMRITKETVLRSDQKDVRIDDLLENDKLEYVFEAPLDEGGVIPTACCFRVTER